MLISATHPPTTLDDLVPPEDRDRLDRLDVLSRRVLAGKLPGERRSKRRGQSVEFDDYRPYIPGDDLRHVDWNVYARFDRFVLKLFREEEDLAVHLLVDGSASMLAGASGARGDGPGDAADRPRLSKLIFSHRLAMGLAYLALVAQNRVSLSVFGSGMASGEGGGRPGGAGLATLGAIRGRGGVQRASAFLLASLSRSFEDRVRGRGSLAEAMRALAIRREHRGVMVVISDFLEPGGVSAGLNFLASGTSAGRFDTHCVQVLAPGELDPAREFGAGLVGDLRLLDAESGRSLEVTVTRAAVEGYRRRLGAYLKALERDCLARSMSFLRVTTADDPIGVLTGPLRRRGVVG